MYRKAGSQSPLSGVPSGPYTGGERRIEASLLSVTTRQKITQALGGRGEPSPIAYERPASLRTTALATWGVILSTIGIPYVFAIGFDNPNSAWARPGLAVLGIFVGLGLVFGFSLLAAIRRRVLLGKDALRPGKYLFPLDLVDIALPNARGEQIITVRPLGDARDARVEEQRGKTSDLVVLFEGGAEERFPLRGDPSGDVAFRRLEHAQRLLEELSYARELERAVSQDLFFEQRADDSWSSVGPASKRKPEIEGARRSKLLAIAFGRLAPVYATLLGLAIGFGAHVERRSLGDRALLKREMILRARAEAEAEAERASKEAAERAKQQAQRDVIGGLGAIDIGAHHGSPQACIDAMTARQSSKHPEVQRIMRGIVLYANKAKQHRVPITFTRMIGKPLHGASVPDELNALLVQREETLVHSFERVFSEVCPASVVQFALPDPGSTVGYGLEIGYSVTFAKPVVVSEKEVQPFEITFDVALRGIEQDTHGTRERSTFRLTMPPPTELSVEHRPQSIFVVDARGGLDRQLYSAMTARAFDRLYDEVHSLFFEGDPRVPLTSTSFDRDAGF